MLKTTVLISHIPNPRMLKRITALENDYKISLIYWDRGHEDEESFEIKSDHTIFKIKIKASRGKLFKRIIPLFRFMGNAIKALKLERPRIILAGNLDMLLISYFYKKVYDKNISIVYEVADLQKYCFGEKANSFKNLIYKMLRVLERKLVKEISKLILTSPYFWGEYFSKFVDKDKYLFVPNVPYKSLFAKYKKQAHEVFTVGFIGSVRYVKQLKMLIDVVEGLEKDIKILIAGSGPGYHEIVKYAEGKEFVEIYGPYNYEKEIVSLYEKIDCVYSVYDNKLDNVRVALPNRLYEAIACGLPIIVAEDTMLAKFVEENQNGITVDPYDKEGTERKLSRFFGSKGDLKKYQLNCNKIKENYYYEDVMRELLDAFKEITA